METDNAKVLAITEKLLRLSDIPACEPAAIHLRRLVRENRQLRRSLRHLATAHRSTCAMGCPEWPEILKAIKP